MKRNITIWFDPPAMRSKILISASSLRIGAKIEGYQRSKGNSSRMFFDLRLLQRKVSVATH